MGKQINDAVCVASFHSRTEAEMVRGILKAQHIPSFVSGDDAGGMYPPLMAGIRLFVAQKDKKQAIETIKL